MKISTRMEALLNQQINREFYASNLYLSMASYLMDLELNGFANFYRIQSQEEHMHAIKQFDYLHNVGGRLRVGTIADPPHDFKSLEQVIELTLQNEHEVTEHIHSLVEAALAEKDYATHAFLQWFVTEQVEEEALMQNVFIKVRRIGDSSAALYMLDEEMGRRKPEPGSAAR